MEIRGGRHDDTSRMEVNTNNLEISKPDRQHSRA